MVAKHRYGTARPTRPGRVLTRPDLFSLYSLLALALPLVSVLTLRTPRIMISRRQATIE
jgi:hypothetical protein